MELELFIGSYNTCTYVHTYLDSALGLSSISVERVELPGPSQAGLPLTRGHLDVLPQLQQDGTAFLDGLFGRVTLRNTSGGQLGNMLHSVLGGCQLVDKVIKLLLQYLKEV